MGTRRRRIARGVYCLSLIAALAAQLSEQVEVGAVWNPLAQRVGAQDEIRHTCNRDADAALLRRCTQLCNRKLDLNCDKYLEPCVSRLRSRRAQKLQSAPDLFPNNNSTQLSSKDVTFVVFFAVGQRNAEAYPSHQYVTPDLNFVPVLRQSHPGSRIVLLTDQATQFAPDIGLEIWRTDMDSTRLGRNAYANYYQYIGQRRFLEQLKTNGSTENVVFMDMDVLVVDSVLELFCLEYGYGLTINANSWDPVDIGLQFVHHDHYGEAIAWLQVLIDNYLPLVKHPNSFTTGQVVMRNALEIKHADAIISTIAMSATKDNSYCKSVQNGQHNICFFPCLKYNYWEDCMDLDGPQLPQTVETYTNVDVKIFQFVAWRKPGLAIVAQAFMNGGKDAAYKAFAELPHTEAEVHKKFAFNANVTKVCYRDDKGCNDNYGDESTIWVFSPSTTNDLSYGFLRND